MTTILRSALSAIAAFALTAFAISAPAAAQAPAKVTIVVFGFPSLGAFMPPVIKAQKLDTAHGLDIEFVERPPDAYTTQFNSGEFKVGGSAAVLTVGLADARGVKVKYLFNLFDFWGTVVTSRPEIKSVKDLEGKQLAAASSTTNFVMFEFFAKKLGMDPSKVQVVNTAPPGLVGYALADRADAIQLWEPAYTLLKAKKPSIQMLDTQITKTWTNFAGGERIPYLGVAAHSDWIEQNQALIPKLYATYKEAAGFIAKHPEEAAALIAPKSTPEDRAALVSLIKANDRLGMSVVPAGEVAKQIDAVYKAGVDVGYFKSLPSNDTIYAQVDEMTNSRTMRVLQARRRHDRAGGRLADSVDGVSALSVPASAGDHFTHHRDTDHGIPFDRCAAHRRANFRRAVRRLYPRRDSGDDHRPARGPQKISSRRC